MIKESLRGKKIAITGSTGFLGTALVELLLREIDDVQIRLLIRPSGKRSAEKRLERDILESNKHESPELRRSRMASAAAASHAPTAAVEVSIW